MDLSLGRPACRFSFCLALLGVLIVASPAGHGSLLSSDGENQAETKEAKQPEPKLPEEAKKQIKRLQERVAQLEEKAKNKAVKAQLQELAKRVRLLERKFFEVTSLSESAVQEAREQAQRREQASSDDKKEQKAPPEAEKAYNKAFSALTEGNYDEAAKKFQQFIKDHPDSSKVAQAHYWQAEAFYIREEYADAVEQYKKLIDNFPNSDKAEPANYKMAYSYYHLDDYRSARKKLLKILDGEPRSDIKKKSQSLLEKIRKEISENPEN